MEQGMVTPVGAHMVNGRCRLYSSFLRTLKAERIVPQLCKPKLLPRVDLVPTAPRLGGDTVRLILAGLRGIEATEGQA
jgi:hypothetical protein